MSSISRKEFDETENLEKRMQMLEALASAITSRVDAFGGGGAGGGGGGGGASLPADFQERHLAQLRELRQAFVEERGVHAQTQKHLRSQLDAKDRELAALRTQKEHAEYRVKHLMRSFPEPAHGAPPAPQ